MNRSSSEIHAELYDVNTRMTDISLRMQQLQEDLTALQRRKSELQIELQSCRTMNPKNVYTGMKYRQKVMEDILDVEFL